MPWNCSFSSGKVSTNAGIVRCACPEEAPSSELERST
uniref:Uncharacterized protein n=1 Tax=Utricularia reniformis TaxID=192314 RepID=A0A1Y0B2B3_9LAMI|nr:hypothetical protein AEK19_MT1400 [Utricularia reniformis]ART31595.1 hypothetical protein AEK19_MT1400 [Utricularia reniformis]